MNGPKHKTTIFVHNSDNRGVSGVKVKVYGSDDVDYTGKDGTVDLLVPSGTVTIFVKGFTAYHGSASRLPKVLSFQVS